MEIAELQFACLSYFQIICFRSVEREHVRMVDMLQILNKA